MMNISFFSRKSLALCMMSFLSLSAFSQWTQLASGTSADLNSVFFTDEQNGWIVGKDGVLRHTSNGGTTWASQSAGTGEDIFSIHFINSTTGWLSGKEGVIRHTTDGGSTWTMQLSGVDAKLNAIHFSDALHGIAVGEEGTILTTTNGGINWILRAGSTGGSGSGSGEEGTDLYDVQMTSTDVAYACGKDGHFIKTINGGVNWVAQSSTVTEDIEALHFPSASKGYICYELGKVKQTNGNGTFTSVYAATSKDLKDVWFITEQRGWVVGDEGRILLTNDGGTTWSSHNANTTEELNSVHFPSAFVGYVAGKDGLVFKLTNANQAGIEDLQDISSTIAVYPNPAQDELKVMLPESFKGEKTTVQIIDQTGKTVLEINNQSLLDISLNIADLPKGLYNFRAVSSQHIAIQKFVKL